MIACDGSLGSSGRPPTSHDINLGSTGGRQRSRGRTIEGFPAPGGQEVDAALVAKPGVRGEIGFDGGVIVAGLLKLVSVVQDALNVMTGLLSSRGQ